MRAWVHSKHEAGLLQSEIPRFMRLALAWEFHQLDEDVIKRQEPAWIMDLHLMGWARTAPETLRERIQLPPGYSWTRD